MLYYCNIGFYRLDLSVSIISLHTNNLFMDFKVLCRHDDSDDCFVGLFVMCFDYCTSKKIRL